MGEENKRQMVNNLMREIGIVMGTWYVDFCVDLPGNGARNPSCYLLSTVLVFPEEEGMMQQSSVSISSVFENQGINPVGGYARVPRTYTNK